MKALNICEKFIEWIKLLFINASAAVNLNGNLGGNLKIERGVRQGCTVVFYLFSIMGEILIHIIKKVVAKGMLK